MFYSQLVVVTHEKNMYLYFPVFLCQTNIIGPYCNNTFLSIQLRPIFVASNSTHSNDHSTFCGFLSGSHTFRMNEPKQGSMTTDSNYRSVSQCLDHQFESSWSLKVGTGLWSFLLKLYTCISSFFFISRWAVLSSTFYLLNVAITFLLLLILSTVM